MATDWTSEMQAQFERLQQALTDVIKTELRVTEERLAEQFRAAEQRLSGQYQTAVEAVRGEVRLAAEAWGGTLEGIQRDIRAINETFGTTIADHTQALAEHSRDIAKLTKLVKGAQTN